MPPPFPSLAASQDKKGLDESRDENMGLPDQVSHRIAAEKAIARFGALDSVAQESKETFIHLLVGRGFGATER